MEHKVGDTVAIAKGHAFFSGSLGTVVKTDKYECTVELVVPLMIRGMRFKQITSYHKDFKQYQMHTLPHEAK